MERFGEKISAEACSGKEIAGLLKIRASTDALILIDSALTSIYILVGLIIKGNYVKGIYVV